MVTKEDLANAILDLNKAQKASDERYDKRQAQADKRIDKLGKLIGNISNNQGEIAEEFFIIQYQLIQH